MQYHNFHQTPGYISNERAVVDHLRFTGDGGWGSRQFSVNPPKLPTQEEVDMFADSLVETSQQKMLELLDRQDFLENKLSNNIKVIQTVSDEKGWNDFSEEFYTLLETHAYTEVVAIQRFLKYWRRIYEMATKEKLQPVFFEQKSEITEDDIARAKEVPIQDLYDGNLRHSFGKLAGLCPFHEDSTPSFTIFENDNHFYCFGCNAWGDAIDFYMKSNHVNMVEAVKALNGK